MRTTVAWMAGFTAATLIAAALAVAPADSARVSFPGKAGKIVFVSNRNGNVDLYAINPTGSGLRRLTRQPYADVQPSWSSDGQRIAFTSARSNVIYGRRRVFDLMVVSIDRLEMIRINGAPFVGGDPAWAPDGRRLAYEREAGLGYSAIHIITIDGSTDTQLTKATFNASQADWSPRGRLIAFTGFRSGRYGIYLIRPTGNEPRRLFMRSQWNDFAPSWSPDGKEIAFASFTGSQRNILFIANADGSHRINLTRRFGFRGTDPVWSPDGGSLAYTCGKLARTRICVGSLRTGVYRELTRGSWSDSQPAWQPISK